ncbi:hypothetical protein LX32DRAFT_464497 [Colletotrichum zoysiae]|uniref:Uncharacterized protein n=1 Tax=Colletotrichum zoysiae TaxID=1216348 RepID=A0AAD9HD51_9PEZI|nr:hypothetical protein LX32DRAFT_464497 [Colletotrichum zoysiae]
MATPSRLSHCVMNRWSFFACCSAPTTTHSFLRLPTPFCHFAVRGRKPCRLPCFFLPLPRHLFTYIGVLARRAQAPCIWSFLATYAIGHAQTNRQLHLCLALCNSPLAGIRALSSRSCFPPLVPISPH